MLMKIDFLSSLRIKLSSLLSTWQQKKWERENAGHNEKVHYTTNLSLLLKWPPIHNQHFFFSFIDQPRKIRLAATWNNFMLNIGLTYTISNSVWLNVLTSSHVLFQRFSARFLRPSPAFFFISLEFCCSISLNM